MQLRDRTLAQVSHASWSRHSVVMERSSASNIPPAFLRELLTSGRTRPHFRVTINVSERGAQPSLPVTTVAARSARPRPRISGFTWDIPVLWQEIIACECVQDRPGTSAAAHFVTFASLCTMCTFPRLPSRDRVLVVDDAFKMWRAHSLNIPQKNWRFPWKFLSTF